ncbi:hypothetical protein [Noviherbaspirillum pedocola]|uniref:Uncharacterized protein n=1 Tax=Noviherbaspirillum pedocola TaxID=2801341 RepID=A0A934SWT6_9BURK|nr:hypothetical protein [Noviherbaspirillum pedocola]MBK4738030.1 hypothetical protein [Noviherbaspirillum pedocola]
MTYDARLIPWLELADELEEFDRFMHTTGERYFPGGRSSRGVEFDAGTTAAKRMRKVAASRWMWSGCKRDQFEGIVEMELRTFRRWISESGGESWYEETEAGREMLARIANIERKFKQLMETR